MSTATRETPHERMFNFNRKTSSGPGVPKWLVEAEGNEIWVRNFNRRSKTESRVKPATLVEAYPRYARVKFPDGRIDSVSLDDVAPKGSLEFRGGTGAIGSGRGGSSGSRRKPNAF